MKRGRADNSNRMMVDGANNVNSGNNAKRWRGDNDNLRMTVYQTAFMRHGPEIYNRSLGELADGFGTIGARFFPIAWAYLVKSTVDEPMDRDPQSFKIWEFTEGLDETLYPSTLDLKEKFSSWGTNINLLSDDEWRNLWALLTVSYHAAIGPEQFK